MNNIIVSPSILSADFANLERDIKLVEKAGADWLHIDVMDGHFVPNITIGVPVTASIKKITNIPLDVHLMIDNPKKYVEPFVKSGADIITFHYEAAGTDEEIFELISYIKSFGVKCGMSIKPTTPAEICFKFLQELDMVLVMTVEPGFGGQKFMPECAEKIKQIREQNPKIILQVDGGINAETSKICKDYGANSLVAGNFIYKSGNIPQAIAALKQN